MAKDEYQELLDLRKKVKEQEERIEKLNSQVENLTQAMLHKNKKLFGTSTEKTPIEGQISLFNEAEDSADSGAIEPTPDNIIVSTYKRTPRKKGSKEAVIKDLPRETVECVLEGEDLLCPYCATEMNSIGKNVIRTEVEFIPPSVKVIEYVQYVYKCPECGTADSSPDVIIKAPVPKPIMKRSLASPSTVAEVIYQKYVNGMPLYRQERDWLQRGFNLSRSTMANWIIRSSNEWLKPMYNLMKNNLSKCGIIHADETRIQCNKEEGKKASSQSFMWLYRSGETEDKNVVIFEYTRTRAGKHAQEFLKEFDGFLVTDAYAGYEKVDNIIRCLCWSHVRRYFIESIPLDRGKEISGSKGSEGRSFCDKLFKIEREIASLCPEERLIKRQEKSKPVLEAFWSWIETINPMNNKKLAEAITYSKNQKIYLENFLLDGRIPLSNNAAENCIRPFAVGRRGWLFADTPKGAESSAIAYSIVETAKANNLNVFQYLNHLFKSLPNINFNEHPQLLEQYLPWSGSLPECCYNKKNKQKDEESA